MCLFQNFWWLVIGSQKNFVFHTKNLKKKKKWESKLKKNLLFLISVFEKTFPFHKFSSVYMWPISSGDWWLVLCFKSWLVENFKNDLVSQKIDFDYKIFFFRTFIFHFLSLNFQLSLDSTMRTNIPKLPTIWKTSKNLDYHFIRKFPCKRVHEF